MKSLSTVYYSLNLIGRAFSLAIATIEFLLLSLLVSDTVFKKPLPAQVYMTGEIYTERDVPLYLVICCLFVLACKLLSQRYNPLWHTGGAEKELCENRSVLMATHSVWLLFLSLLNIGVYTFFFLLARHRVESSGAALWVTLALLTSLASIQLVFALSNENSSIIFQRNIPIPINISSVIGRYSQGVQDELGKPLGWRMLDIVMPITIIILLYIPSVNVVAGRNYNMEEFHHWNYYIVGPALSFQHSKALGTEVYSQYGVGWPVFFSLLSSIIPLTYTNLIHFSVVYCCLYFVVLYMFYRLATKSIGWSCIGVLFSIWLHIFNGVNEWQVKWIFPSATILRAPLDLLFFIAIFQHNRSHKNVWLLWASAIVGLSIWFETDTGIALLAAFIFYNGLYNASFPKAPVLSRLFTKGTCFLLGASILLSGLYIASRGTVASGQFWKGWLEAFTQQGSPNWTLPLVISPFNITLILFITIITTYLTIIAYALLSTRFGVYQGRSCSRLYLAPIAAYGTITMLVFVGRSHPFNIFYAIIPFTLISIVLLSTTSPLLLNQTRQTTKSQRLSLKTVAPCIVSFGLLTIIFGSTGYVSYPNVLQDILVGKMDQGLCLFPETNDACGLHNNDAPEIEQFQRAASIVKSLSSQGYKVAILDASDTTLHLASNTSPWWRYSPFLTNIFSRQRMQDFKVHLKSEPPDFILIRKTGEHARKWNILQAWVEINQHLEKDYVRDSVSLPYQIWRRKSLTKAKNL